MNRPPPPANHAAGYSVAEQMVICAAREITNRDVIYVGVGLPMVAALLAKHLHAPDATLVFETGIIRSRLFDLPAGVDTFEAQQAADMLADVFYVNALAQRGRITLGFLGGGQIDRHGNINSNAVGDYRNPAYRFPGCGGGNDIASLCGRTVIIMRQTRQRFPARVDFVSCPGYLDGTPGGRERAGLPPGTGPHVVITDLGVYGFRDGEMELRQVHGDPATAPDRIRRETGWALRVSPALVRSPEPTPDELHCLRERVDSLGRFTSGQLIA